jgi:periplasmic copper chaperone A
MSRVLLPIAFLALASAAQAAPVSVHDAWLRLLPGDLPAGGYFTLHNGAAKTLVLAGADTKACGSIMLHRSMTMGGMASMADATTIAVPAGGDLVFAPGGYHLMCMAPAANLKIGAQVPVTLHFADGTKLDVPFAVRGAAGR